MKYTSRVFVLLQLPIIDRKLYQSESQLDVSNIFLNGVHALQFIVTINAFFIPYSNNYMLYEKTSLYLI